MSKSLKKKIVREGLRITLFLSMFVGITIMFLSAMFCFVVDPKCMLDSELLLAVAVFLVGLGIAYCNAKLYNYFFE